MLRYRYRPPPIQPELQDGKENASLSLMKKEKPPEEDKYASMSTSAWDEPVFLATHTQIKRQEVTVRSDEGAYRSKHHPCIKERVEQQKEWAREQLEQAKVQQQREALKFKQNSLMQNAESGPGDNTDEVMREMEKLEEELKVMDDADQRELQEEAQRNTKVDYAEQLIQIKERKLTTSRRCGDFHRPLTKRQRQWTATKLWMGIGTKYNSKLDYTEILPWLLLGRYEAAINLQELLRMDVTHILNMTSDLKNMFPQHFVYEQVRIRDSVETDIGAHFQRIVNFIKRCQTCKGRILVHCTAGASRAPSAVLAYLVYHQDVTLVDAYKYVTAKRTVVKPNPHFLFQLAMMEVQLFGGCSVYFHPDWRFFEFNLFRAENVPGRDSLGLYRTTIKLLTPKVVVKDLLAEAENAENAEKG